MSAANEALRRSNRDLETFAYVASHDLREPLRMVTSYGSLLNRRAGPSLDETTREFLHFMTDGAHRMQAMIDDLLTFSRVERAAMTPQVQTLTQAMDLVRHDLGVTLKESGATLTEEGGETELTADPTLLHRLLINLVTNAIKYGRGETPAQVTVRAWRVGDNETIVETADKGPGIPQDAYDRVFQMFQRLGPKAAAVSDTTSNAPDAPTGTGMGLSICRRIAERHGGAMWIEPDPPGQGARFRFSLPVQAVDDGRDHTVEA